MWQDLVELGKAVRDRADAIGLLLILPVALVLVAAVAWQLIQNRRGKQ